MQGEAQSCAAPGGLAELVCALAPARLRDLEAPSASTSARTGTGVPAPRNPLTPTLASSTTLLRTRTTSQSSTGTPRVPAATPGGEASHAASLVKYMPCTGRK